MQTIGTSESDFEEDVCVNNAAGSNGAACGGICLVNSNKNVMLRSTFYGNGSVDYANGNVDFGIGFEGSSSENRVRENHIGGKNQGGLFFFNSDKKIRPGKTIYGKPPSQDLHTFLAGSPNDAGIAF